jgi:hypothetical protein
MVAGGVETMIAYTYDGLNWLSSPSGKTVFTIVCLALAWNGSLWVSGGEFTIQDFNNNLNKTIITSDIVLDVGTVEALRKII